MAGFKVGYVHSHNTMLGWSMRIQHPDMTLALFRKKCSEPSCKQHRAGHDGLSELAFRSPSEFLRDRVPVHLRSLIAFGGHECQTGPEGAQPGALSPLMIRRVRSRSAPARGTTPTRPLRSA